MVAASSGGGWNVIPIKWNVIPMEVERHPDGWAPFFYPQKWNVIPMKWNVIPMKKSTLFFAGIDGVFNK